MDQAAVLEALRRNLITPDQARERLKPTDIGIPMPGKEQGNPPPSPVTPNPPRGTYNESQGITEHKISASPLDDPESILNGASQSIAGILQTVSDAVGADKASQWLAQSVSGMRDRQNTLNERGSTASMSNVAGQAAPYLVAPVSASGAASRIALGAGANMAAGIAKPVGIGEDYNRGDPTHMAEDAAMGGVMAAVPEVGAAMVRAVPKAIAGVSRGIGDVRAGYNARTGEVLDEATQGIKNVSNKLYTQSKEAGAILTPDSVSNIAKSIDSAVADTGKLHPKLHNDTLSVMEDVRQLANSPLSLEELDQTRKLLSGVINKNRLSNPEDAFKATKALNALDDAVEGLTAKDIQSGDKNAIELLTQARGEWSKAKRFENISSVLKSADGDPNRIKSGLQKFVNNPKNLRGMSASEVETLRDAARNSTTEKLLKMGGKFGIDLGSSMTPGNTALPAITGVAGYMGVPHAAPVVIGGTIARQLQKYLARGKAENVLQMIEKGSSKSEIINHLKETGEPESAIKAIQSMTFVHENKSPRVSRAPNPMHKVKFK